MNAGREAGKLGIFAVGVALMYWISSKAKGFWDIIIFRGGGK